MSAPPRPEQPLLFLDYDGTLAEIVDDPAAARPHPAVPGLLRTLRDQVPLWVVTGRDAAALEKLLPVEVKVIGLHGAERGRLGGQVVNVALARHGDEFQRMRATVPQLNGVHIEDKSGAFAVHYRHAADPDAAVDALQSWAEEAPSSLERIWGKKVVELRPADISKGTAVAEIAQQFPDHVPVYLGDDVTDEDAFRSLSEINPDAVTVKVGSGETDARFRLPDVDAVVEYLQGFLDAPAS